MKITLRLCVGLVAGCITAVALALAATFVARTLWPDYAAAEPEKAYSVAMLLSRLAAGAFCTAGAACVTTIIAGDNGKAASWLGGVFLAVSLPIHLCRVWADYPVWYHLLYLSYLVPVAGLTGRVAGKRSGGDVRHVTSSLEN
ncbi:MAG: hypothetical protein V4564_19810 [Pseudomonadota bacterium]